MPYIAALNSARRHHRGFSFGHYPTTPSAERRPRRDRPRLGNAAGLPVISSAQAQSASEPVWRHALSLFGDIKYPADFKRFDYVNPDAPKGGIVRQLEVGTFDNFNIVVAGLKGSIAQGVGSDLSKR